MVSTAEALHQTTKCRFHTLLTTVSWACVPGRRALPDVAHGHERRESLLVFFGRNSSKSAPVLLSSLLCSALVCYALCWRLNESSPYINNLPRAKLRDEYTYHAAGAFRSSTLRAAARGNTHSHCGQSATCVTWEAPGWARITQHASSAATSTQGSIMFTGWSQRAGVVAASDGLV